MLPIVGRHADVWHAFGSLEALRRKSEIVDEHARRAGREPGDIGRSTALSISEPIDEIKKTAAALADAGFSYLTVSWPGEGESKVQEFVDKVMPEFS